MNTSVIAFAGAIASGKSTISSAVAEQVACPRVSFGGHVRTIARLRGLPETRENLQKLGESLVDDDPRQFCVNVLAQAAWEPGKPLIVDGVRHVGIAQVLKELVRPSEFRLVFVDTSRARRQARFRARDNSKGDLSSYQSHSTEVEVESSLRELADLVVDGNHPPEEATREIVQWSKSLP